MEMPINILKNVEKQSSVRSSPIPSDLEALRKYSAELLCKFRTVWNEMEYQEWCEIQRILHKKYVQR